MSYTRLLFHIVFRTKYSAPSIDMLHEAELYSYIWGIIKNKNNVLYRIGGMPDHIHLFVELTGKQSISDFIRDIKTSSSKWLKENPHFPLFDGWGKRYAAFSYSIKDKETIINYIAGQKAHHSSVSLENELRQLLAEQKCVIDEQYFMNDNAE